MFAIKFFRKELIRLITELENENDLATRKLIIEEIRKIRELLNETEQFDRKLNHGYLNAGL